MSRDKVIVNGEVFTEERLLSGSCFVGSSIAGDELTVDTMGATVYSAIPATISARMFSIGSPSYSPP